MVCFLVVDRFYVNRIFFGLRFFGVNDITPPLPLGLMKTSTVILTVMVTVSLVFSVAAFLVVANMSGLFAPNNPSNTPTPFPTASPTPMPPKSNISIAYTETVRESLNDTTTRVTLTVNAEYLNGSKVSIDYSQFYIDLTVFRTVALTKGEVYPVNGGAFTLGASHPTQAFQLNFEFPTKTDDGTGLTQTFYALRYNGNAEVDWLNPEYH